MAPLIEQGQSRCRSGARSPKSSPSRHRSEMDPLGGHGSCESGTSASFPTCRTAVDMIVTEPPYPKDDLPLPPLWQPFDDPPNPVASLFVWTGQSSFPK